MDISDFKDGFPGRFVKVPDGVFAFVPDPLPPKLALDMELVNHLSGADLAIGGLKWIGKRLPNPHLVVNPLRTREAIYSSMLEGTIATAKELLMLDALPKQATRSEAREVANYILAIKYGMARLGELPVSKRLICELHKQLLSGVRGQEYPPGEFRRQQNAIGMKGQPIEQVRFLPPPVSKMKSALDDLELFLHSNDELPLLIKLALVHYQFEAIHPFMDGNGRIGRLLITLLMCEWNLLDVPCLYMSSYFERNKDAYKDHLLLVSQRAAWKDWIHFFLRGVISQSKDTAARADRLLDLQGEYRDSIQTTRATATLLTLVDDLFLDPWTTTAAAASLLKMTHRAAQGNIDKLVAAGILVEATGRRRDRIYIAPGIIEIIEKDSFD